MNKLRLFDYLTGWFMGVSVGALVVHHNPGEYIVASAAALMIVSILFDILSEKENDEKT